MKQTEGKTLIPGLLCNIKGASLLGRQPATGHHQGTDSAVHPPRKGRHRHHSHRLRQPVPEPRRWEAPDHQMRGPPAPAGTRYSSPLSTRGGLARIAAALPSPSLFRSPSFRLRTQARPVLMVSGLTFLPPPVATLAHACLFFVIRCDSRAFSQSPARSIRRASPAPV